MDEPFESEPVGVESPAAESDGLPMPPPATVGVILGRILAVILIVVIAIQSIVPSMLEVLFSGNQTSEEFAYDLGRLCADMSFGAVAIGGAFALAFAVQGKNPALRRKKFYGTLNTVLLASTLCCCSVSLSQKVDELNQAREAQQSK